MVAACKDECVTNLTDVSKKWFADLGSEEIWNLKYRDAFCFIGKKGKVVNEKRSSKSNKETVSVTKIFTRQVD